MFVDLAMISAGEEDLEIDRISCMHTSCLGFGPLIFRYRQEHGFNELIKLCEPVWQAVSANPSITQKLVSFLKVSIFRMFLIAAKPFKNAETFKPSHETIITIFCDHWKHRFFVATRLMLFSSL